MIKAKKKNYEIRIKGGIGSDGKQFFALVHLWDNEAGTGHPEEFRDSNRFNTSHEAMAHYIKKLQPTVHEIAAEQNCKRITVNASEQLLKMNWVKV